MLSDQTRPSDPRQPSSFYRLAWAFYLVLAIAAVVWIGWSQGSLPLSLFVNVEGWLIDLLLGLASGVALIALWDLSKMFVRSMRELERELAAQIGSLDGSEALALALISGFSEELFFRGAVQSSWGWLWATVTFTFMHVGAGKIFRWWTFFAFIAALVFGSLTLFRGNILPAVIAHSVVNGVNLRRLTTMSS